MLIIGYGNRERGDDGAGVLVAEQLRELGIPTKIHTADALALIELWGGVEEVTLIDAVVTGAPAGTVHKWDVDQMLGAEASHASSHGMGLVQAIGLARSLGCLPGQLHLYGIEGKRFAIGQEMSTEVKNAVERLVRQIAEPS